MSKRRSYITVTETVDVDIDVAEFMERLDDVDLLEAMEKRRIARRLKIDDGLVEIRSLLLRHDVSSALALVERMLEPAIYIDPKGYQAAENGTHPFLHVRRT